jgi:hypothetical protein
MYCSAASLQLSCRRIAKTVNTTDLNSCTNKQMNKTNRHVPPVSVPQRVSLQQWLFSRRQYSNLRHEERKKRLRVYPLAHGRGADDCYENIQSDPRNGEVSRAEFDIGKGILQHNWPKHKRTTGHVNAKGRRRYMIRNIYRGRNEMD